MKIIIGKIAEYKKTAIREFLETSARECDLWKNLADSKTILLKPNLLGPYEPDQGITTHPVVLEAMIEMLLQRNKQVWLGDSPGGSNPVEKVWEKTGIKQLKAKYNIELLNFSNGKVRLNEVNGLKISISNYLWEADAIINIAKFKTHSLMYYTGAVKNLYGFVPGLKKSDYHKQCPRPDEFSKVLESVYKTCRSKITWNIIDGIIGMEGDGPSAGDARDFGIMFASNNAAALDSVALRMMGFNIEQVNYINKSLQLDEIKISEIEVEPEWKEFRFSNVKTKKISNFIKILANSPKFIKTIFRSLYKYHPAFNDRCRLCGVCVQTCPVQALVIRKGQDRPELDEEKCIKCLCCHEVCPYHAVYIKKSALAKLLVK